MKILNTADYTTEDQLSTLNEFDREAVYNGLDCCVTLEILDELLPQLDNQTNTIYQRSLALRAPILEMSMRGIRVHLDRRRQVRKQFIEQRDELLSAFNRILCEGLNVELNWRSNRDMMKLFYDILGLPVKRKRNANGAYTRTINRDALEGLQVHFWAQPLVSHLLALRDIQKKIDFLNVPLEKDSRWRSTFNIAGTKTGRLSSSESELGTGSNSQNIDRSLRSIFIPDDGYVFVNIDLEQGDSRNLGALCWEHFHATHGETFAGAYLDACESGDLHTQVALMTWKELTSAADAKQLFYRQDSYRQTAKKLGHGVNFVGTPRTMSIHTKTPVSIISNFQRDYFSAFPCIPAYHDWVKEQLATYSHLTTLYNRRRYFFGRANDPKTLRDAVAYSPQSMTADAINNAMLQLYASENEVLRQVQILCQVHDSLLLQVPETLVDEAIPLILQVCRSPLTLTAGREFCVPLEAKVGYNWGEGGARGLVPPGTVRPEKLSLI